MTDIAGQERSDLALSPQEELEILQAELAFARSQLALARDRARDRATTTIWRTASVMVVVIATIAVLDTLHASRPSTRHCQVHYIRHEQNYRPPEPL